MLSLIIMDFDAEPEVVTDILQLQPSSVRRKGEVSRTGKPISINSWYFDVHPDRLTDGEQHENALALLISQLRDREANFARLHAEIRPEDVGVWGGMHLPANGQCGIWLMPDDMMILARCGISWDMHFSIDD